MATNNEPARTSAASTPRILAQAATRNFKANRRLRFGPCPVVLWLVPTALVIALYWPTAVELVRIWNIDPNYSHGFAVPVLSLVFAAYAGKRSGTPCRATVCRMETGRGLLNVLLGLGLHLVALYVGHLFLDVAALICLLRGTVLVLGGREANRAFGFAALFLVFMAPLPISWYQPIARLLQHIVSAGASSFLELCGVPVYREGYLLHLSGYTMEIGEACSGMRQLTTILALAVVVGYFASVKSWYRWTLALAAVPVAVAANCVRVILASWVLRWWGPEWAEGVLHTLEGVTTVALATGLLLSLAWGLAAWDRSRGEGNHRPSGRKATNSQGGIHSARAD